MPRPFIASARMALSRRVSPALAIGLLLAATPTLASAFYAPPAPGEDAPEFSGSAELGYTKLSGNTNSETLIAKGTLSWLSGAWTHILRAETRRVEKDDDTSAEQYLVAGRERYDLDGPHYLFGFARWEKDRFSGYRHQTTMIAGYGRQLLEGPPHSLSVEGGPGYRHDALENGEDEDLAVGYAAVNYQWALSEHASVQQELSVEGTAENVTTRSFSALTTQLNSHLALRLSHELKSNSNPPDEASANTDRTTTASLLYSW
ncbi:putative salt-induced outer membrane protein [Modicisalibacter muralis]|uniref:Putative salt-induced outer membrane protein n=1 Tax=Modicisalibacter muralis TaxID=119000 RepID=A0A1G9JTQ4_9GAMM|nr:DUF481 domain-containing protein [Halomonas muralis]SDL40646.1 putative salt-induced outer membrane protein [Halomonas muralis]